MKKTLIAGTLAVTLAGSGAALAGGYDDPVVAMPAAVVEADAQESSGGAMAVLLAMTVLIFGTVLTGN